MDLCERKTGQGGRGWGSWKGPGAGDVPLADTLNQNTQENGDFGFSVDNGERMGKRAVFMNPAVLQGFKTHVLCIYNVTKSEVGKQCSRFVDDFKGI
uniref:Uncharacterized protein n=1 Tax=Tanacetum cinerariifolium TaxID=118510 RepID=A0A699HZF9_TANCI|nr:hypothetical protein [Tanacetum cinerariifolium]